MKTAEELISDITKWDGALHRETVVEIVNHAIKEAIEETVRRCADKAEMSRFEFYIDSFIETKLRSNYYSVNDGLYFKIDDQSILKVADELKKELGL